MKNKIFMSFAHKDQPLAEYLTAELAKHGYETWSDKRIQPGEKWEDAVTKALRESDIFMPLISQTFLSSDFNIAELGAAYGLGINMIPVLISGDITQMPFRFHDFLLLDARGLDKKALVNLIVDNTRRQMLAA